ncbi:MAG: hypothetical protein ACXVLQ_08415 [Bacteriovorax sp.]
MNKITIVLPTLISILAAGQAFARGSAAIYECNDGEAKMTQIRNGLTLESGVYGKCEGHVDIVGSSKTTYKVQGFLGASTCNKGLTIEWEDQNGLGDSKTRFINLISNSGAETLVCHLTQESND